MNDNNELKVYPKIIIRRLLYSISTYNILYTNVYTDYFKF